MPSVEYVHGVPIWIDLGTPDVAKAAQFYGSLFGWTADEPQPEAGGYTMFRKDGKMVAGVGPLMSEQQPVAWSTYLTSDDADDTAAKVREAGGTVLVEPMDVMDAGRMAFFMDPTGAAFGIWQPGLHKGAELVNEPGALTWNELATRDVEGAKAFYNKVFGITGETRPFGGTSYTELKVGERLVGGLREMGEMDPPSVPPHWLVYFAVGDTDASVATVTEKGGNVLLPPMTIDPGRFSIVTDPQGATFAVIALNPAMVGR
jgi:predicted enzyme related to lactoylglutathione lyase